MSSYLDIEGVYDQRKMFAVTNWSDEDFSINWKDDSGDNWYTVKAGEVKTFPQYLAYYITKNLVDREMYKAAEKAEDQRTRERLEMAVVNRDLRKPYEDKTIQEVRAGEESPEVTAMRDKIRKEMEAEKGISNEFPAKEEEFAGLKDEAPVEESVDDESPVDTGQ